jgi:hypothetical protein
LLGEFGWSQEHVIDYPNDQNQSANKKKARKTKDFKKKAPKKLTKQEKHDDFLEIIEYLPQKLSRRSSCSSLASLTSSPVKLTVPISASSQTNVHNYEDLRDSINILKDSTNIKQQSEFQIKSEFLSSKMKFLCDGPIILPKLSPNIEAAVNDKSN